MPREFVIFSPEPITVLECATAAARVDPDLGLARLWDGGGTQIAHDSELVLAVLRSSWITSSFDLQQILSTAVPGDAACWSELYGPFDNALTEQVAQSLAETARGTLIELGGCE